MAHPRDLASRETPGSIAEVYEYGRNKPAVIDEGAVAVRLEGRRGAQVLADETARVTYNDNRLAEEGARPTTEVEETMLDRAAQRAAGLVTPAREPVTVLLARSDDVDRLNDLGRRGHVQSRAGRAR